VKNKTLIETLKSSVASLHRAIMRTGKESKTCATSIAALNAAGEDGKALAVEALVALGREARDAANVITANVMPLVGAAAAVSEGLLDKLQFDALTLSEAKKAFKIAGGSKGGGLEAAAWVSALDEHRAAATDKKSAGSSGGSSGGSAPLTADEVVLACIQANRAAMTESGRNAARAALA
jgi:hypothetical protein